MSAVTTFEAEIDGAAVRARLGSDALLPAPVWCLTMGAPVRVVSGGTLLRSLGPYAEVQLPDLRPGEPREVVLAHADGSAVPNRSFLPRGNVLRLEDDALLPLPPLPAPRAPSRPPVPLPPGVLPLVPQPRAWAPAGGTLDATALACPDDDALRAVAALAERLGLSFDAPDGAPVALRHDLTLPAEGYRLDLTPAGVTIWAGDRAGRLHAGATLLQLLALTEGRVPCGRIDDAPRFAWRGQHLDCARHAFAPATVRRLLDLLALLKMNRLHWHLAGDEGFRLDLDAAPDLARLAGVRGEGRLLPALGGHAGGSYGKEDVAGIVDHAGALGIGVMPSLSLPGHALALCLAAPALRDPEDRGGEAWDGFPGGLVSPAMGATWDLLPPVLDEVAAAFPLGLVFLGGEAPPGAWEGSPAVDRLKAAQGLQTPDEVTGWMMARLGANLGANGARAAAWAGAAAPPGALLVSRDGTGEAVQSPPTLWLDRAPTADPDGFGSPGPLSLEDVAAWRPPPEAVGVQGGLSSALLSDDAELWPLLLPRILGVAAQGWEEGADGPRLRALADALRPLLDRLP